MSSSGKPIHDNLHTIFHPESIAVVGTNRTVGTVPHDIFMNILKDNYQGIVYPVSPGANSIAAVKSFKYILDIPDSVDMAVIVFSSSLGHMAMQQCGGKRGKTVIIISAGFREVGGAGIEREKKILEIADKYGISFIGPNCLGVINTDPAVHLNASFARKMPERGNIGFLSQSGALCTAVLDYALAKHIGFSKFVSFGNKADVSEIDLLHYLKDDPETKVILLYLEEISDGRALLNTASTIIADTGKPILILKSGRTSEGAAAAASHTGSLAGSDEICDAAFAQAGILRCQNIEEMFNIAIAMAYQPLPRGNRVAIITNAGGPGVLATDAAIRQRLQLAEFSESTTARFKKHLPKTANIKNPVDVIGDARADRYDAALSAALKDDKVDGALVILTPQSMTDIDSIANKVCEITARHEKPVYTSFMGETDVASGIDILQRHNIPHYILPESMCTSFSRAFAFQQSLQQKKEALLPCSDCDRESALKIIESAHHDFLTEDIANQILKAYGLPLLDGELAKSGDQAVSIAGKIGYPVVLKVVSADIAHKFDVGGVKLNLKNAEEIKIAYKSITKSVEKQRPEAVVKGIYVQKMAAAGTEVILGLKRDRAFGPVLMFGLGGIYVEIYKDVEFGIIPLKREDMINMIKGTKSYPLLAGARGRARADIDAILDCMHRLSQLALDLPSIAELDINPLIVHSGKNGASVADVKIVLHTDH